MESAPIAWSVGQAVEALNTQLFQLSGPNFFVEGEVGRVQVSQGKWISFDLKDTEDGSLLKCWGTIYQMPSLPQEGLRVRVRSTPKVNGKYGQFSLQIHTLDYVGQGAWQLALKALREKLLREGLFAEERKRALPTMPERIGLITSRDAAAYGDFLRLFRQRWGGGEIQFFHVTVQGDSVVGDVCGALGYFARLPAKQRPEVLVITRGGGGQEELMPFNAEALVRAVAESPIPTVVAIGHERDVCLAEEVADMRAATPSHAAQCVCPDRQTVAQSIRLATGELADRAREACREGAWYLREALAAQAHWLQALRGRFESVCSMAQGLGSRLHESLAHARGRTYWAAQALTRLARHRHAQTSARVEASWQLAQTLHPQRVLARGYAVARVAGRIVRRADALAPGEQVEVELGHGSFTGTVEKLCQP